MKAIPLLALLFLCFACEKKPAIEPFDKNLFHGHWVQESGAPDKYGVFTYVPFRENASIPEHLLFDGIEFLEEGKAKNHSPNWTSHPITESFIDEGTWTYDPSDNSIRLDFDNAGNIHGVSTYFRRYIVIEATGNQLRMGFAQ